MKYVDKLIKSVSRSKSVLCVGLDPRLELIPERLKRRYEDTGDYVEEFCSEVIDATSDYCCAYKPNLAFFESLGAGGLEIFDRVRRRIPDEKIVIADAKRGDIGSTAEHYKIAFFDKFRADAITLNPMMGFDTLDPYIHDSSKAIYSLVLTSNPGSEDMLLRKFEDSPTLSEYIAGRLQQKMQTSKTHIGMVVGATHPDELERIMAAYPSASLLIPGIGSQGGSLRKLLPLLDKHLGVPVINSSRSILYAGKNKPNWKDEVAAAARNLGNELKPVSKRYI